MRRASLSHHTVDLNVYFLLLSRPVCCAPVCVIHLSSNTAFTVSHLYPKTWHVCSACKGYDPRGFLKCLFLLLSDTSPPLLLPEVISTSAFCLFPPAALPLCVHISVPLFHKGFGNLAALHAFTRFPPVTEGPSSPGRVLCAILTSRTCLPRDSLKKMSLACCDIA